MKPKRNPPLVPAILAACLIAGAATCHADSARSLMERGNTAFKAGNWESALKSYDEASIDAPESPQIYFNRGATFYRQEDYEKASDAFKLAALKSVEPALESRARYNLGNCSFREAERQRDSDPQKAFKSCEESIKHYQDALNKDREFKKPAENIEIVRIYMKALLDEINKKKEEEQRKQEQQEDLAKKLKELIERQQKELGQNQQLVAAIQKNAAGTNVIQQIQTLSTNQLTLQTDTQTLSHQIEHSINPPPAPTNAPPVTASPTNQVAAPSPPQYTPEQLEKLGTVKTHVDNAAGEQQQAVQKLRQNQLQTAAPNQQTAVDELTKALEALNDENQDQQQQQQPQNDDEKKDDEEKKDEKSEQQEQGQNEDKKEPESDEKKEEQKQAAQAEDILKEEKDNREKRQPMQVRGYRAVDKNW